MFKNHLSLRCSLASNLGLNSSEPCWNKFHNSRHSGSAVVVVVKRRLAEAGQLQQPPLTLLTDGRRAHSEPSGAHTVKVFGQGANSLSKGLYTYSPQKVILISPSGNKHSIDFLVHSSKFSIIFWESGKNFQARTSRKLQGIKHGEFHRTDLILSMQLSY